MSKGSLQRPCNKGLYDRNYKRIFESGTDKSGVEVLGRRKQADVEPLATERK